MRRLGKLFLAALVLLLFAAGVWLGSRLSRGENSRLRFTNTATVLQQIQTLSELVTVKYVMEKVEIVNSPPENTLGKFVQGENRVLLLAHGIVKAGVDLKRLRQGDVKISGQTVFIRLPPAQITDAYLDEKRTQVIDWQRGFLRDYDKDLETAARQNAVDDIRRAARAAGILPDAEERARLELAALLHAAGFTRVEFLNRPLLPASTPETAP
ncbi:MAG TPA: DUF4230 domain-containing protein [Verrucomicrobiae bacterium]|nr:DUF4230 domain-containing protein [Verrucomicrobiae bacterium]